MAPTEIQEIAALALVFVVHVIGGLLLVWALLDDETRAGWRRRWGRGEDPEPTPPAPRPSPDVVTPPSLPLGASEPSGVRLRGPGRLADGRPLPLRRPGHAPRPTRLPH